jgi:hypothetical protein
MLQLLVSYKASQLEPPYCGAVNTLRVRCWDPRPQVLLQLAYAVQPLTAQSTGQGLELQSRESAKEAHCAPPKAAATFTERRLVWMPEPQVLEQSPYAPKAERMQSIGQLWALQDIVWVRLGQALPPFMAGATTVRSRLVLPPLQVRLHACHTPKAVTVQSTGQEAALHCASSDKDGHW